MMTAPGGRRLDAQIAEALELGELLFHVRFFDGQLLGDALLARFARGELREQVEAGADGGDQNDEDHQVRGAPLARARVDEAFHEDRGVFLHLAPGGHEHLTHGLDVGIGGRLLRASLGLGFVGGADVLGQAVDDLVRGFVLLLCHRGPRGLESKGAPQHAGCRAATQHCTRGTTRGRATAGRGGHVTERSSRRASSRPCRPCRPWAGAPGRSGRRSSGASRRLWRRAGGRSCSCHTRGGRHLASRRP
jgi:hypothetical protein